jgi:type I restriction enzyme S subunit
MPSNYKPIGEFIREVKGRNTDLGAKELLGINIDKFFMPSVANIVGTDLSKYKLVQENQFACNRMHVGRDGRIPVALSRRAAPFMVSPAYDVFEIKDPTELLPEYLMMWFSRREFDRNAWFYTDADVRGGLAWKAFCNMKLPVPTIEKQREIVAEYHTIQNRITLNNQLIRTLETTAQAIYKQWFVEFEFPNEAGQSYKSSGGELVDSELGEIPKGWEVVTIGSVCSKIGSGATPTGGKENYHTEGISLVRSMNVYDFMFYADELAYINETQAKALNNAALKEKDILLNITGVSVARCCIVPTSVLPARVNQHVMIIRPKGELSMAHYLLCLLCHTDNKSKLLGISQSGSTREAITKSEVEGFKIVRPNEDTLVAFENLLHPILSAMDNKAFFSDKLKELSNLLLSKLATIESPISAPAAPQPAQLTLAFA